MPDFRENLGWIIGSFATAIAMAIGWFISSGVVVNLLFLLIGWGIAYFVQTKTQKRAWKREYSIKIVETVYSDLFRTIKNNILSLESKGYRRITFGDWDTMQDDHRYLMVDEKFRTKLDEFCKRMENYSSAIYELREVILKRVAKEETKRIFNVELLNIPQFEVKYKEDNHDHQQTVNYTNCLITDTYPTKHVSKEKPNISNSMLTIRIRSLDGETHHFHDKDKVKEFWESCIKRMKEHNTYKFVIEENDKLLDEARKMNKEIGNRIEETLED